MNDWDNYINCWIDGISYIWIPDQDIKNCMRYYIAEPDQIVFINIGNILKPILYWRVKNLQELHLLPRNIPIYYFYIKKDSYVSNYFRVANNIVGELRINGKATIQYITSVKSGYNIKAHQEVITINSFQKLDDNNITIIKDMLEYREEYHLNEEDYLLSVYSEYPSSVSFNSKMLNIVYSSKWSQLLIDLLRKRIPQVPFNFLIEHLSHQNLDKNIHYIFKKYVPKSQEKWGEQITNLYEITGRAKNRIDEIKNYLPFTIKSYLDMGAGNCEIVLGIGNYLNISKENLWAIDINNYCSANIKERLQFLTIKSGNTIPMADHSVDLITCFQSLHHMTDLHFKLSEMHRILSDNGIIIIREHDCFNSYISYLIDIEHVLYDNVLAGINYSTVLKNLQGTVYRSKRAWTVLLESIGFKLIEYLPIISKNNPTQYYNAVYKKILN